MINKSYFYRSPFLAVLLLASEGSAIANCNFVKQDNSRLGDKLGQLQLSLAQLERSMLVMEQTCQREQSKFATKSGAASTAESCVALKESAAMNQSLSASSKNCALQIQNVHRNIDLLNQAHLGPFNGSMGSITESQKSVQQFLPNCAGEFQSTDSMRTQTQGTLVKSIAAVARGKIHEAQFATLAATTGQFAQTSQAAVNRCVSEGDPLVAGNLNSQAGGVAANSPGRRDGQGESTITGTIDDEKLKSSYAQQGVPKIVAHDSASMAAAGANVDPNSPASLSGAQSTTGASRDPASASASSPGNGIGTGTIAERDATSNYRSAFPVHMGGKSLLDETLPEGGDKNFILALTGRDKSAQAGGKQDGAGVSAADPALSAESIASGTGARSDGEQVSLFQRVSQKINQRAPRLR